MISDCISTEFTLRFNPFRGPVIQVLTWLARSGFFQAFSSPAPAGWQLAKNYFLHDIPSLMEKTHLSESDT
jgi:hypothetical protein